MYEQSGFQVTSKHTL